MRVCTKCSDPKSDDDFAWKIKGKRRNTWCKACQKKYRDRYYERNRKYYIRKAVERTRVVAHRLRMLVRRLKTESPCADCGNYYLACQMDFDHVSGTKLFTIAGALNGKAIGEAKVLAEIAKCEIVCANCHRVRTLRRRLRARQARARGHGDGSQTSNWI